MQEFSKSFYSSKAWRKLSYMARIATNGNCNRCKKDFPIDKLIAHHRTELTPENVNNPQIALNIENIEVLCQKCHNSEHKRFGGQQDVYIVWGSPLSGKSTFIAEQMRYGDIVCDIDNIWQAVSGQERYVKPNHCKAVVFTIWRELLSAVRMRSGQWGAAWITMSQSDEQEVIRQSKLLGAEIINIKSSREDCLSRCNDRPAEWKKFVNDWWDENEQ